MSNKFKKILFLLFTFYFLLLTSSFAGFNDRVVAFVDDQAITLSELKEQYKNTLKFSPDVTINDVLNTIINRKLLLREAKKYRIEAPDEGEIIREYIDLKIKAFIRVSEVEMEEFYNQNIDQFQGKSYENVREEIEDYFTERELNEKLKDILKELRTKAYVKIQLDNN
ncbi:MAG: SurA N-terminal domain-containing protein [Nitrospirota bacterium]